MNVMPSSPFDDAIGTVIEVATPERVVATLTVETRHLQPGGLVHGGVYATLVETTASVGATLSAQSTGSGLAAVGLDNHTSFLRSVGEGARLRAEATPVHAGQRVQAWAVTIEDMTSGKQVAVASMRLFVVAPPP
jgi:1,4-dihydroxy-2-naphthoyl-CoA hydrolase